MMMQWMRLEKTASPRLSADAEKRQCHFDSPHKVDPRLQALIIVRLGSSKSAR